MLEIKLEDLESKDSILYVLGLFTLIVASYGALYFWVSPLLVAGTISISMYLLINFALAVGIVGILKLANKYWLQHKLINKIKV